MPSLASTRELHEVFNFQVAFDRDEDILFQSCSPIEATISVATYKEGGATIPIKDPDNVEYENVTLERGASKSFVLYQWFMSVLDVLDGIGNGFAVPNTYKRDIIIYQLGRRKERIRRYILFRAFPVHFKAAEWDNSKDEVVIESLTLAYDFFSVINIRPGEEG